MIPIEQLAEVWRNRRDERWSASYDQIQAIFERSARKHALIRSIPDAQRKDEIEDLVAAFWIHLLDHPDALEARRVRGAGAYRTEIWRFLNGIPHQGEARRVNDRLRRHLREAKVVPALREDQHIFERLAKRGLWGLHHWQPQGQSQAAPHLPDPEICAILPALPSRLAPQRAGQLPPLVDKEPLPAFLEQTLLLSARPRWDWDLTDITWQRLEPPPDGVLHLLRKEPELDGQGAELAPGEPGSTGTYGLLAPDRTPEQFAARRQWARRVDVVAGRFVDGLPVRTREVAALGELSVDRKADLIGVSRSTISNENKAFQKAFLKLAQEEELDEEDARLLLSVVLDILEAEGFLDSREVRA